MARHPSWSRVTVFPDDSPVGPWTGKITQLILTGFRQLGWDAYVVMADGHYVILTAPQGAEIPHLVEDGETFDNVADIADPYGTLFRLFDGKAH